MKMESAEEKILIRLLKDGQREGFDQLYATFGHKIYNLAYRIMGDHKDAEDITQETFIQVYRHIDQFREDSQLYTWIYTIARNLCLRWLKQKRKKSFASMETLLYSARSDETTEAFFDKEKQILLTQIKDGCFTGLLRCLSFYQRMAFILHVLLDLPMDDVADILVKSDGATKVLVHRARQNLKDFLCKNCSLYDSNNPCCCENLMSFSLAQGWIKKPEGAQLDEARNISPEAIQAEVDGIRKIVELYKTLKDPMPSDHLVQRIQNHIQSEDRAIFSRAKV
jgi:RNA polymerase sigma factor (sigma-70 family)